MTPRLDEKCGVAPFGRRNARRCPEKGEREHRSRQADFRCDLDAGFVDASFACFLPAIGISISFCPADAFRAFFAGFFGAEVSAAAPPTLRRSASIRSTTFSPRGRSLGLIGLPARFWLMSSIRAVS